MFSIDQFVIATLSRDGATGVVADPPAGALLSADGAGGASWDAPAPADLTLYVSLAGSNSNDGATPSTALRTIEAAMAAVRRQGWTASASVRLLPGTHDLIGGGIFRTDGAPGARESLLAIEGDSLASLGTFAVQSTASPGFLVEVTIATAVPLAAEGERVRFTSGALDGRSFIVGNVSGPTFTLMGVSFNALPNPGDTFVLEAVTAAINITDNITFTGGLFLLRDLQLIISPVLTLADDTLILSGVHVTAPLNGSFINLVNGTLASGSGVFAATPGMGANPMGFSMTSPGIGIVSQFGGSMPIQNSYFRDAVIDLSTCTADLLYTLWRGCLIFITGGSYWSNAWCRHLDALATPGALTFTNATVSLSNVDISNSSSYGIYLATGLMQINDGDLSSATPNGSMGVLLDTQGSISLSNFASPTITGAGGDVVIGQNPVATWADVMSGVALRSDFASPISKFASVAL